MPKIVNPRNHQGADTDASTRGFIYKLELGFKYTPHSRAGAWTPKWVTAGFFMGCSRAFSEGVEEKKFFFFPIWGKGRGVSYDLIWDFLPRTFCSFSCKVQLLFAGA